MLHLFRCLPFGLLALSLMIASAAPVSAGTITGLTVAPAVAKVGTEVSATATGSGLCGAVNIDWGDGTAITYATETLPVTKTHVYQSAGAFTLRAQGHGNCDGQAVARVTITAASPPPPPPARLAAIELSPPSPMPRTPVTITLQGSGTCRIGLDFGDGNSQDLNGQLPLTVRHTYAVAGSYAIVAIPAPPCGDRQTATLVVGERPRVPRISGIEVTGVPDARGRRAIRVNGDGSCAYTLDFGDGNSEGRNAALPDVVQHNYPAEGRYTIVATAAPPCEGVQRSTIVIGAEPGGRIARLEIRPAAATVDQAISMTVRGSGTCRFTVDFGDGKSRALTETLPHELSYRYQEPGDYQIFIWTEPPCGGEATAEARVRRR
jgi:hypothetical protein